MLFHPDVLAGQLPAPLRQVEALAARAFEAHLESGLGFGALVAQMDGFEDWALRQDSAFASGLFRSLLEAVVPTDSAWVCGIRDEGLAVFYIQSKTSDELRVLAAAFCEGIRKVNLAPRGGPVRLTVSVGVAHSVGFHGKEQALEHVEFAARRGARLVARTGGDQFAMIERFGARPEPQTPAPEPSVATDDPREAEADPELIPTDSAPAEYELPRPDGVLSADPEPAPIQNAAGQELVSALRDQYGEAFEQILSGRDRAWEQRVENLERRLAKLGSMLESKPAPAAQTADMGIASRFRSVQGLDEGDADFEAKQGLMSALYLANQKLRGQVQGRSA